MRTIRATVERFCMDGGRRIVTNKTREADGRRPKRASRREGAIRAALLAGTALVGVALAQPAAAQIFREWEGGVDDNWFNADNWDAGSIPDATNRVIIDNSNPGGSGAVIRSPGAVSNEVLIRNGGLLTISDGGTLVSASEFQDARIATTGTGLVVVTGAGSRWTIGTGIGTDNMRFQLGSSPGGQGTLRVLSGARVDVFRTTIIGQSLDSTGRVEVIDATFAAGDAVSVGSGTNSTGTLLVSGGTIEAPRIRLAAAAATSTGTLIVGAAAGDPAAGAGTIDSATVEFEAGTATLLFNHTANAGDNYVFDAGLDSTGAGTHALNHHAGVTNYTGDGSGFVGTTTVSGGTLFVDNALGGTTVVTGGVLGGAGTIGALTMNGGVLAPGNSIGTLNVASTTFNPGSVFQVELNDGGFVAGVNNDLLNATGTVAINGGTIHVTPVNGTDDGSSYTPGTYTIITAGGGVSGTFDTITDDFAFLGFEDAYDANNVYLISSLVSPGFCLPGFSANQCASGGGVSSLSAGNALYDAVVGLSNTDAPGALDQLSGEMHASGQTALINNSLKLRTVINNRINSAFGGQPTPDSFAIMGYGPSAGLVDLPPAHRYGAWAHAYGAWGSTSATANTAAMRQDDGGILVGADGHLGGAWHGGVFTGYGRSSFRINDRTSSGSSDNFHLGAYAGGELGAVHFNAGAVHSWHSIGTNRNISFPGFTDTLTASYNARTMQVFGEASYRIDAGGARFEPFAGLAHVNLHTNGFTETGGAAALTSAASSTSTTFTTLGIRASTDLHMGDMKATARGMIGWRHAFGNTAPTSSFAFAGGNSFVVSGAPIARNTAVVEMGLDMEIGTNATLGLSYDGQFGSGTTSHSANARLGVSF